MSKKNNTKYYMKKYRKNKILETSIDSKITFLINPFLFEIELLYCIITVNHSIKAFPRFVNS